ncbi:ATP-binding cassette domain-containing protein [Kluyvera genomosp. 3]|uniref:ATP-binding cassette domain-containing protein n=1 Tax=Kluyvera genomosp. 3 TaxID=2774055 RepID=A0A6G9RPH6_9ENTR|nr:ATP-binding cassette domain-containing protein [Kluyvera genomosp. 3]QIR27859.1 ATP-binding cassette domain-containing protein [Kluyvera genomosp. 3]
MLQVRNLTLTLAGQPLLRAVNFVVPPGEIVTLMGPSGCGKSTLFAWMVGALDGAFRAQGELWLNDKRTDTLPTEKRRIGILFQDALLFDHLSVGQNLRLALPANVARDTRQMRVEQALEHAELSGFYARDPATLSGGQRARVALLRALLAQPDALLLDEPFSRLDQQLRGSFRQWVFSELRQQHIPVVQVTHDPDDVPAGGRCLQLANWR